MTTLSEHALSWLPKTPTGRIFDGCGSSGADSNAVVRELLAAGLIERVGTGPLRGAEYAATPAGLARR